MKKTLSRRDFLKACGVGAVGATAAAALVGCSSSSDDSSSSSDTSDTTTTESESSITSDLGTGESMSTATEVDTSRITTATNPELRYPYIAYAITSDPTSMEILNWWKKAAISGALFECMGEDNKDTNFPDMVMVKSYTESDTYYVTYEYEKNELGEDTKWPSGVTEVSADTDGAVEAFHWDVELYDYIHDQEGRNITASDVVFCYKTELNSGYALKYTAFIWCEAIDTYTVRFYWNKSEYDCVGSLEFPFCKTVIFSQEGYESGNYTTDPVTTSAYKYVSYTSGSEVIIEATDDYWQTDESLSPIGRLAHVQTIRYPVISEAAQVVIALETGIANYTTTVSTDDLPTFADGGEYSDKFTVFRAADATIYGLCFNCYEGHAGSDPLFRQGVCYALDSDSVAQGAGSSYFALKGPGSYGAGDYDTSLDDEENWQTTYDPDKAIELIEQSSYNGEKLTLEVSNNQEHSVLAAQVIQILLLNVGVEVEINSVESTVMDTDEPNPDAWDLFVCSAQGSTIVGGINRLLGRTDFDTAQYIGYQDCIGFQNDDTLYELFKTANSTANFGKEATGALLSYIVENAYFKWLYGSYTNYVYTNDVAELAFKYGNEPCIWASTFYVDDQITDITP